MVKVNSGQLQLRLFLLLLHFEKLVAHIYKKNNVASDCSNFVSNVGNVI